MSSVLRISGAWTQAGIASCVHVKGPSKAEDFLLDCGVFSSDTLSAKFVLVTHGHIDHVGSCISHARAKGLTGNPATYYVPRDIVNSLNEGKKAFEAMDETEIPMNIVPVSPGDTFTIGSLKIVVFATEHRVQSQGYAVYYVTRGGLRPELRQMSKDEIRALKGSGANIMADDSESLQLVYTGDTIMQGLLRPENRFIFSAPIFITELTYLDGEREKAIKWGHIHIDDIAECADLFDENQHDQIIFFVHLSQKYSFSRALKLLRDGIPSSLYSKVKVSLHSFGSHEVMTSISDSRWSDREQREAGWGWSSRHSGNSSNSTYHSVESSSRDGRSHSGGGGGYNNNNNNNSSNRQSYQGRGNYHSDSSSPRPGSSYNSGNNSSSGGGGGRIFGGRGYRGGGGGGGGRGQYQNNRRSIESVVATAAAVAAVDLNEYPALPAKRQK